MSKQKANSTKHKTRFDGLDVHAMVVEIKGSLLGHKLANVYDAQQLGSSVSSDSSAKSTFLFKLANPSPNAPKSSVGDESSNHPSQVESQKAGNRSMLLVESGVRFHNTTFYTTADSNSAPPSPFAMKLRKHLRNLRLENVTQLGNLDRVVDFRFGSGNYTHHLIVELYGQGNIILTNDKYVILALLRVHEYQSISHNEANHLDKNDTSAGQVKVRVGNVYPVTYATTIKSQSESIDMSSGKSQTNAISSHNDIIKELEMELEGHSKGKDTLENFSHKSLLDMNGEEAYQWAKHELQILHEKHVSKMNNDKSSSKKRKDADGSANLKMLLLKPNSGVFHYGPSLIEHCILHSGLEPGKKFTLETSEIIMPPNAWMTLIRSLREEGRRVLDEFNSSEGKGYVLYKAKIGNASAEVSEAMKNIPHSDKIFEEFQPHLLKQHENRPRLEYASFSMAVDEFFSLLEGQKRAARAEAIEQSALERLEKIKLDQSKRMEGLEEDMMRLQEHAQLIELHADDVDKAIGVINSALEAGMDWEALEELVDVEKANNNPIALLMNRLILDKEQIVLALPDTAAWNPDSGTAPPIVNVTVSLKETAHGNARRMYDKYRVSKEKANKTAEASEKALEAAEANAQKQIKQAQMNKKMTYSVMMQPQRKQHWFEKFHWFITSDNYLCLGGRDAQQNEQLVKRYLRPGDAYLHADVFGAPTCILRAKRRRTASGATEVLPLSDIALREAGNFAICRSSAWSSKIVTSAWYVESHQVSKTAPTGEYLTVGSFMIRGKKNFLPPVQLEMGIGVLFRLGDDASVLRHLNDRRDFALMARESVEESIKENIVKSVPHLSPNRETKSSRDLHETVEEQMIENNPIAVKVEPSEDDQKVETNEVIEGNDSSRDDNYGNNDSTEKTKKKGLSAKDRKLIKKYGSLEAAEEALAKIRAEEEEIRKRKEKEAITKSSNEEAQSKSEMGNIRGKKSKLKKIAKKYGDQDDQDRELALFALQGTKKGQKKKGGRNLEAESENQIKAAAETLGLLIRDAKDFVDKLPNDVADVLAKCVRTKGTGDSGEMVRWDKLDAEVLEQLIALDSLDAQKAAVNRLLQLTETTRVDNFSASLSGIIRTIHRFGYEGIEVHDSGVDGEGKQRKTKAEKDAEKEAWREILAEDGIVDDLNEDGPIDDTGEINKLTGKPLEEDVILYAIPVCAPYATLAQYKYRVKLTPGNQKRGKAAKQSIDLLCKPEGIAKKSARVDTRYVDMMKAISDNEWVQAILGDVKISAAGASKAVKKQKTAAKKVKKNS